MKEQLQRFVPICSPVVTRHTLPPLDQLLQRPLPSCLSSRVGQLVTEVHDQVNLRRHAAMKMLLKP